MYDYAFYSGIDMMNCVRVGAGKREKANMTEGKENNGKEKEHQSKRLIKMKELSESTGVKRPTIRYYISQGLLPKPHKTQKNMAYYDESCVGLLLIIKKFQKEHFLPLDVIKKAIDDIGFDKLPFMEDELTEKLFEAQKMDWMEPDSVNMLVNPLSKEELLEMSKISPKDLQQCLKIGMVRQNEDKTFNVQDVKIAMLVAQFRGYLCDERGFFFDFVSIHNDFIRMVVDIEFKYFLSRILKGDVTIQDANDLATKSLEVFHKFFPIVHKRYLNNKIKESLNIEY